VAVEIQIPEEEGARIELTPIVDMVFLLLVFFMVGAKFANPVFELELPAADSGGPAPRAEATISIDARGSLYLNRDAITPAELTRRLETIVAADPNAPVILRSDAGARFSAVVRALDASSTAGVRNLAIEHTQGGGAQAGPRNP
jgi:biopolymer transport protein ExbD